ncbi:MAG TPA: tRNA pseudouridine(55) synthase TruB [Candidatus Polarisedimenticolia bacterium]|nr:tRNA pseudouridine(55) synthase TruB [Candidatus Polarisedimenticolia bacterium]
MDGILVIAKPAGPTSHDVVALVRRLSATKKVGHGGTLDPFATGVLPVFVGSAARLVEYHLGDAKAYRATVCFGATSTTDDLDGELTPVEGGGPSREAVEAALATFRGPIVQRPPAYSAVIVGGRRAYALARAGERPVLKDRSVRIDRLELLAWDDADPDRPIAVLDVECSAGTYVRAIARDLGEAVGSGAYLGALVRTASGPFRIGDAVDLETVRAAAATGPEGLRRHLRPVDTGLDAMARVELTATEVAEVIRGRMVSPAAGLPDVDEATPILLSSEAFGVVGVGVRRGGRLEPDKILIERESVVAG